MYPRNFALQKEMCCIVDIAWKQLLNREKNVDGEHTAQEDTM